MPERRSDGVSQHGTRMSRLSTSGQAPALLPAANDGTDTIGDIGDLERVEDFEQSRPVQHPGLTPPAGTPRAGHDHQQRRTAPARRDQGLASTYNCVVADYAALLRVCVPATQPRDR